MIIVVNAVESADVRSSTGTSEVDPSFVRVDPVRGVAVTEPCFVGHSSAGEVPPPVLAMIVVNTLKSEDVLPLQHTVKVELLIPIIQPSQSRTQEN